MQFSTCVEEPLAPGLLGSTELRHGWVWGMGMEDKQKSGVEMIRRSVREENVAFFGEVEVTSVKDIHAQML